MNVLFVRGNMVNKKELIKTIKTECQVELDTKKLNALKIEFLEELLIDLRNLKGEGWKEVMNKRQEIK